MIIEPGELVVVTGASGYIGGRLVPELLERGYRVRCLVRTPAKLDAAPWRADVEVVKGDLEKPLGDAFDGAAALYYLVHTIGDGAGLGGDASPAPPATCATRPSEAGVRRINYLGGLGDDDSQLSPHLASRHEVGRVLAAGPVPVTELRAAIIIGSGSASFEMLRYLVEVLPAMITPRWVDTRCQPIAVRDVLRYLVECLREPRTAARVLEIGGRDVLSYREMMNLYADAAGLRRRVIIPVPVLTPRLSSHWVGLVTPLPVALSRPLVASLINEVIVHDPVPSPNCCPARCSAPAKRRCRTGARPRGRASSPDGTAPSSRAVRRPSRCRPTRAGREAPCSPTSAPATSPAPSDAVFAAVCRLGGDRGWHSNGWLWGVRGAIDTLIGGVGMRRGRRDPDHLRVGDALDFWRVEALEEGRLLLRLRAEMKLPGEAWLEWRVEPTGPGSRIHQLARYHPRGLWGRLYWLGVAPFHRFVFPGLLRGVITDAERVGSPRPSP